MGRCKIYVHATAKPKSVKPVKTAHFATVIGFVPIARIIFSIMSTSLFLSFVFVVVDLRRRSPATGGGGGGGAVALAASARW